MSSNPQERCGGLRWGRPVRRITMGALALAVFLPLYGAPESIRRRGQFLRTDVVRTESKPFYSCALAATAGAYPVVRFRKQELLTHHEVSVYQVVIEEKARDDETDRDAITYRVSPDEEMRGDTTLRRTHRDLGALTNETFQIGDASIRTDADGLYVDSRQVLLRVFDDMGTNTWQTVVRHKDLGEVVLKLSRYLARRWSAEDPELKIRMTETDLLLALGRAFEPLTPSDHSGLHIDVEVPESMQPGTDIHIVVTATNEGSRPVSCLLGRVFSRHAWLSGMNVYLGNIEPGKSSTFERVVRVPSDLGVQPVFAALGFWDILGSIKEAGKPIVSRIAPPPMPADETP